MKTQISDFVSVVLITKNCVGEVVTQRLDSFELMSKILIKVCVDVPINASILIFYPLSATYIVYMVSDSRMIVKDIVGLPVDVAWHNESVKPSWGFPVQNKCSVCNVNRKGVVNVT